MFPLLSLLTTAKIYKYLREFAESELTVWQFRYFSRSIWACLMAVGLGF